MKEEVEEADDYFRFACMKGKLLEKDAFAAENGASLKKKHAVKAEAERTRSWKAAGCCRKRQQRLPREGRLPRSRPGKHRRKVRSRRKERPLPVSHYTVKRGETLPQIAAQPEVYNDYRFGLSFTGPTATR